MLSVEDDRGDAGRDADEVRLRKGLRKLWGFQDLKGLGADFVGVGVVGETGRESNMMEEEPRVSIV
jgi:hypothetical protein